MSQASSLRKTLNQQWAAILNSALSTIHDHADHSSISHLNDKSTAKIRSSMDPQKSMSGNSASNSKVTSSLFENHDDSGQIYRYGGKDSGDDSFAMLWR